MGSKNKGFKQTQQSGRGGGAISGEKDLIKLDVDPIIRSIRLKSNKELIEKIRDARENNQFVALVLKDGVQLQPAITLPLFEVMASVGASKHLDLFLYTTGGATETPWRIVSLLREYCEEYTAIVPFIALSAGTHIALGANQILMSEISTLGPVDPTTSHPLLPRDTKDQPIPVSVEDLKNCIKFIAQQLKDQGDENKYTSADMTNIVTKLFEHIEPLSIGAVERAYGLSRLVTRKVLETHLDPVQDKEKIDTIVSKIGGEYFSHSFPITRRDVELELQLKVIKPDPKLFTAIMNLYEYYRESFQKQNEVHLRLEKKDRAGNVVGTAEIPLTINVLGYLDTIAERRILLHIRAIKAEGEALTEDTLFANWVKPLAQELPADSLLPFMPSLPEPPKQHEHAKG